MIIIKKHTMRCNRKAFHSFVYTTHEISADNKKNFIVYRNIKSDLCGRNFSFIGDRISRFTIYSDAIKRITRKSLFNNFFCYCNILCIFICSIILFNCIIPFPL